MLENGSDLKRTAINVKFCGLVLLFLALHLPLVLVNQAELSDGYAFLHAAAGPNPAVKDEFVDLRLPLYPIVIRCFLPFTDPIIAGRLAAILAGCLCLFPLFGMTRRLCGETAAFFAVLLFAVSPLTMMSTTRVMSETLFLCLVLGTFYFVIRVFDSARTPDFAAAVSLSALASLTRPEGILLAPILVWAGTRSLRLHGVRPILYSIPGFVLHSISIRTAFDPDSISYATQVQGNAAGFDWSQSLTYLITYVEVYPWVLFYPVAGLAIYAMFQRPSPGRIGWILIFYCHIVWLGILSLHWAWSTRFLIVPTTMILPVAAIGLQLVGEKMGRGRKSWSLAVAIAACCLAFSMSALLLQRESFADVKEAALYIRARHLRANVYSDEFTKTAYYMGRYPRKFQAGTTFQPGDVITLHSFYSDLNQTVRSLAQKYEFDKDFFRADSDVVPLIANSLLNTFERTNSPVAVANRFTRQHFVSVVLRVVNVKKGNK